MCNFRPYFGYADQLYYGRQFSHGSWSKQEPAYLFYKYFPKWLFTFVFEQFCRLQWLENSYYIWGAVQTLNLEIANHTDFFFFPPTSGKKKKRKKEYALTTRIHFYLGRILGLIQTEFLLGRYCGLCECDSIVLKKKQQLILHLCINCAIFRYFGIPLKMYN